MPALSIKEWKGEDAINVYEALSDIPYALLFDSNDSAHPLNCWSFICWSPIETITAKNGVITHNNQEIETKDVFSFLQKRLDHYNFEDTSKIPFRGGLAGYFGYDLGRQLEDIPELTTDDMNLPDMMVGIYTNILAFDHKNNKAWKIGDGNIPSKKPHAPQENTNLNWTTNKSEEEYCKDIQTVIDYIHAGDVYQVNLSRRFEASTSKNFNSFLHYKHLRRINPAPFSSFMNFGEIQLASCSPEQFLSVNDRNVETRPIKGTLPSSQPSDILINSKKDIAENTMIVDLLRNDLSKVCDFHSVKVPELCKLETFEGLHHLVSTVRGVLQKNKKPTDLLHACFPGGSITGAPKIRAMHVIEELEETRRGPYCGAMGYIDFNGRMDTNITIRTLIYANNKAYLQTGSGIVSDSLPKKELQESLDKAQKIFESFKSENKESTVS